MIVTITSSIVIIDMNVSRLFCFRPISLLRLSLLRLPDSNFRGNPPMDLTISPAPGPPPGRGQQGGRSCRKGLVGRFRYAICIQFDYPKNGRNLPPPEVDRKQVLVGKKVLYDLDRNNVLQDLDRQQEDNNTTQNNTTRNQYMERDTDSSRLTHKL